jgi:uncharacterized protein (TIGR03000 family)
LIAKDGRTGTETKRKEEVMRKHVILGALLGSMVLLAAAESAQAQFYRGQRGGFLIGAGTPGYGMSYGRGYPGYGYGYSDPWGYGSSYASGWSPGYSDYGYYRPYRGFSLGLGLRPRYSQVYDSGIYYYTNPTYESSPIITYPSSPTGYVLDSSASMPAGTVTTQAFYTGPSRDPNAALVRVSVPNSNANIWFDGSPTQQQGFQRLYVTPPLDRNRNYTYAIKASWMENGQEVSREKQVDIRAGQEAFVSFTDQNGGQPSTTAGQPPAPGPGQPHLGKLASVEDGAIIMTEMDGTGRHTHRVSPTTEILLDGRRAELSDLKPGMQIDVTTRTGDPNAAVKIEARSGASGLGAPPAPGRDSPP